MIKYVAVACCLVAAAAGWSLRASGSDERPLEAGLDDTEAAKALARRWFEEVINQRNLDAIADIYAIDYVHYGPDGAEIRGLETVRAFAGSILAACDDRRALVLQQVAEGDLVVTRFTSSGHHTGVFQGVQPTGKVWTTEGIVISRIKDGKIAEDWEITHHSGF
ncbi:MAG: ester cyclase [Candidatus Eisenbacteria bacterium]|uniref:Ester cyclase n=1 Tax=Eiseniibacteriota bacterium TaxID=2212470 RepID=A0A956RNJ9_UNCEI|nr:ester cyclase [Candidatus Eisenbacteria bacterium]